ARFVFFGTQRPIDDRILSRVDCDIVRQTLPALSSMPWRWPSIYLGLRRSAGLCRTRFELDPPAVVIGTGGMASVPAVREAHRLGIPTAILNPDALPGRANRHLAGIADVVFAQWEDTVDHYPQGTDVRVLGCPIRPGFDRTLRVSGIARFGLRLDHKTLLVTGASQGAKSINEAVVANLDLVESLPDWQILHLTGEKDHPDTAAAYRTRSIAAQSAQTPLSVCARSWCVQPYTDHMADALSAADLVISRAGASTLAEITAVGKPSILMPYPYHRDQHQFSNAKCLARRSAARIVRDAIDPAINAPALRSVLEELLTDPVAREAMSAAARSMGRGNAAADIAEQVLRLAEKPRLERARESVEATC
ncbi:MAG: glycosyltransferase, partial [Planctomycetota bacterium]